MAKQEQEKSVKQAQVILTINQRRWKKFKTLKRGYYSLVILVVAYVLSFFLPLLVNNKALLIKYNGELYSPALRDQFSVGSFSLLGSPFQSGESLGQGANKGECNYRELQDQFEQENSENWVVMPLYPFGPLEDISVEGNIAYLAPFDTQGGQSKMRIFGTDDRGRDVFARMAYGFQISISFALLVAFLEYLIGIPLGAAMGYFGRWFDILMQRFMEIWGSLPFLFIIIIIVSIFRPNFLLLVTLISLFAWLGPTNQIRAQFYREKTRDYVAAAISIGVPTWKIIIKHILPNSLVPIITFFPFAVVGGIGSLVSLDFLGFGLPPPTPSWGEMVGAGLKVVTDGYYWLVLVPLSAMFTTLILVVFIGEGVREAYDPKVFSRLR